LVGYNFLILSQWREPADDAKNVGWARESFAAMQPFAGSGRYMNYLDHDDTRDAAAAAFGPNYRRLQEIKATFDPTNLFAQNLNIVPVGDQAAAKQRVDRAPSGVDLAPPTP